MFFLEPQTGSPVITLDKTIYTVGEFLEGNCSSSPAYPAPYLTWYINKKQVNIFEMLF